MSLPDADFQISIYSNMSTDADDLNISFYEITEKYPDEASAIAYFEAARWPNGPQCPASCGAGEVVRITTNRHKPALYCTSCEIQFTVATGTVMEDTRLPLRKWLFAFHLMGASKKGMSALQVSRMLTISYRTAWHLCHRIRAAMGSHAETAEKMSGIVESDEMYVGGRRKGYGRGYRGNKIAVQAIVERGGDVRTIALKPEEHVDGRTVGAKLRKYTEPEETVLMSDESNIYDAVGESFKEHHTVNHSKEEYVRRDPDGHLVTTNTAEGLFANLRRQITGTHHHTSKKHLPKYLTEYGYKYNTRDIDDGERVRKAIAGIEGKRLTLFKPKSFRAQSLVNEDTPQSRGRAKRGPKNKKSST